MMRHSKNDDAVGFCQTCGDALSVHDVLVTGQAKVCTACWDSERSHGRSTEKVRKAAG